MSAPRHSRLIILGSGPSGYAAAVYAEALKVARERPAGNEQNVAALEARLKGRDGGAWPK